MNNKLQPALIAGVAMAVIGAVLNLVSTLMQTPGETPSPFTGMAVGCLSCLLTIGGGAFAVYLYVQRSSAPATTGDGAVLGLLAGLVSAVITLLVTTPLSYFINRDAVETQLEPLRQQFGYEGSALTLVMLLSLGGLIITPLITMLGGLLGVPLFEKRKGDAGMPPPPPPGGYGGGAPPVGGSAPGAGTGDFGR